MGLVRVEAVPELTVWGMGTIHEGQAHLLLSGGGLGLGVPFCPLCFGSPYGTFGWSQALFYIFFSGVGHFPSCREHEFLVHFAFCLGVKIVQKGFHLTSQA